MLYHLSYAAVVLLCGSEYSNGLPLMSIRGWWRTFVQPRPEA